MRIGHVRDANLGDEVLIRAVIQNVRRRHPDAHEVAPSAQQPFAMLTVIGSSRTGN